LSNLQRVANPPPNCCKRAPARRLAIGGRMTSCPKSFNPSPLAKVLPGLPSGLLSGPLRSSPDHRVPAEIVGQVVKPAAGCQPAAKLLQNRSGTPIGNRRQDDILPHKAAVSRRSATERPHPGQGMMGGLRLRCRVEQRVSCPASLWNALFHTLSPLSLMSHSETPPRHTGRERR